MGRAWDRRLSEQQLAAAVEKATRWRLAVENRVRAEGAEEKAFFSEVFRIAGEGIETDVDGFCDRAELAFEEIEAHGQEPQLDDDWLGEITGENDNFYFSTDSIVSDAEKLPGRKRGRKPKEPDEQQVVKAVEEAVQNLEQALMVAHHENPHDWIQRISMALEHNHGAMGFWKLQEVTRLSTGALFLGLLLGQENWTLQQQEFYGEVMVKLR